MQNYIGLIIDRYHITKRLGQGGMAVVYKAYDTRLEREVAIKLIRAEAIPAEQHERFMKRFEREAKSQARFNHRHIVPVYDYGEVEGAPYLVMAYIASGTLKARTGQPIPYQQALRWMIQVADALSYAHKHGVIHRDIKPSNILFDTEDQPILTDFGIAKILETDEATLTGTGLGVGTPEYMAPEQWQGQASPATDQYALGVVLYELLTGQKPYTADTPVAVALKQLSEPMHSPRSLVAEIPEPVEKLLYKALAKDPQDRYVDMVEIRYELEKRLEQGETENKRPVSTARNISSFEKSKLKTEPSLDGQTVDALDSTPEEATSRLDKKKIGSRAEKSRREKSIIPNWAWWTLGVTLLVIGLVIGISLLGGDSSEININTTESIDTVVAHIDTPVSTKTSLPILSATETRLPINAIIDIATTRTREIDGMEQILIPEGVFLLGLNNAQVEWIMDQHWCSNCKKSSFDDTQPQHEVFLDAYWIDKYEVTYGQYANFLNELGNQTTYGITWYDDQVERARITQINGKWQPVDGFFDHPVEEVTWFGAQAYCKWAEDSRLPTEAEWEKAARGIKGQLFPWEGFEITCEHANFEGCYGDSLPVGSSPKGVSPYGVHDMVGNVLEWVNDRYSPDYYSSQTSWKNPRGPEKGLFVVKSGSYYHGEGFMITAIRGGVDPNYSNDGLGFRCASSINIFSEDESHSMINTESAPEIIPIPYPADISINTIDRAEIVLVPEGYFWMGYSNEDINYLLAQPWCSECNVYHFQSAVPQHKVFLDKYWINKFEITNDQFSAFVKETDYITDAELKGGSTIFINSIDFGIYRDFQDGAFWGAPTGPGSENEVIGDHPVVHISWNDASAYCEWSGGRLPSEAEWEKAARGTDGRLFPWGNEAPNTNLANYRYKIGKTKSVGSYPQGASPYNVMDMAGNVWEWVMDRYDRNYYYSSPDSNPLSVLGGSYVQRGGSWANVENYLLTAHRWGEYESNSSDVLTGFRCVYLSVP